MERLRTEGAVEVAALLRRMAAGIDSGRIPFGDQLIACPDNLAAIVEVPTAIDDGHVLIINLRMASESRVMSALAVEQELSHPGG